MFIYIKHLQLFNRAFIVPIIFVYLINDKWKIIQMSQKIVLGGDQV